MEISTVLPLCHFARQLKFPQEECLIMNSEIKIFWTNFHVLSNSKNTGDFFCNPPRGDSHHFVSCTNNSLTYAFKKTSVWSATWEYWQYIFCLPLLIKKLKDRIKGLAVRHAARLHSTHGWCYEENIVTYRQVVLGKLK